MPLILLSPSCKTPSSKIQITLAENITPVEAPATVARVKGFFQSEGLEANAVPFASGRLALDALIGGKADFATVAETPIVLAAMQGQPIQVLCTFTASERNTKILARKDRDINSPVDLKGKKVAVTAGTNGAYFFELVLKNNGLTPTDLEQINLAPQDMAAAIARGDVDAICTWEPHVRNAQKTLGENAIVLNIPPGQYTQTFNIVVLRKYAEEHPAALTAFLKALLRSESFMREQQAEAIAIAAKENNMTTEDMQAIWPDYDFRVTLNRQLLTALTGQAEWAARTGLAPAGNQLPPLEQLILAGPLSSLRPDSVNLK